MDRSDKLVWLKRPETQEFLEELRQRFNPQRDWALADDWGKVQRLAGQHDVMNWIETWHKN